MKKNRKNTLPVLIDIKYRWSINKFEEFYRNSVTYSEIEQESYIELKTMVFDFINRDIKFRKFNREGHVLTLKANMLEEELEELHRILDGVSLDEEKTEKEGKPVYKKLFFMHDFHISRIKLYNPEEDDKIKPNKEDSDGDAYENLERVDSDFSEENDYLE